MRDSYWWCANCTEEVDGSHVTYGEMHDNCGHPVESITPEKQERIAELEADNARLRGLLKRIEDRHRPGYDHLAAEIAREGK